MIIFDKRILAHFDFVQLLFIIPILVLSHILISEANEILAFKQYIYYALGFGVFLFFFIIPFRKLEWIIPFFYWFGIVLLISVDLFGVSKLGAKRWLEIPLINFTIQPSEIIKPAFILMLAYMVKKNPPPSDGYDLKSFLKFSFIILLPFILILKEPDLGTAMILLLGGFGTLFIIHVNKKIWISLFLVISVASPVMYQSLHDYQKKRITEFLSEESSYHVKQSIIAISNGGMSGKPKDEATQTHFKFLPIATSDFIFAYNSERFGFMGNLFLMGLYLCLIIHLITLNYQLKEDYFTRVVATSIGVLIFIYAGVNISMTIGLAPVVGVPLPFFSYGGSSFITFMCLFGMLQNLLTFKFKDSYKL
ncbi:FtsW/RodA/SpoVE family cell cycle protein [Campylobacter ureolyticus]|uniref:FtsW/RodA/SpoVE family cell cycle protein n=1 Tax=Campylobacter ureolyticus TaxID=827 RepID=UPI0022B4C5AB|nr:FtsW/RodA/SpoVE family cell cycle protein [Campylobacter ureolyticus]MCZ6134116.1 FtsW/RodA/SpoVE family cell cycle protein [Campylobacter ureolyticus]MCZ6170556.1 FtsW/RodA/SpoVE family cell cycle protein [Campylobacter ureolyticus]